MLAEYLESPPHKPRRRRLSTPAPPKAAPDPGPPRSVRLKYELQASLPKLLAKKHHRQRAKLHKRQRREYRALIAMYPAESDQAAQLDSHSDAMCTSSESEGAADSEASDSEAQQSTPAAAKLVINKHQRQRHKLGKRHRREFRALIAMYPAELAEQLEEWAETDLMLTESSDSETSGSDSE